MCRRFACLMALSWSESAFQLTRLTASRGRGFADQQRSLKLCCCWCFWLFFVSMDSTEAQSASSTRSLSPSPSPSTSSLCPPGWMLYTTDGSETSDSCLQFVSGLATWSEAVAACPTGSHMLTLRSSDKSSSTGLHNFTVTNLHSTNSPAWLGMSQSSLASFRNRDWAWIDGTDASNLNCGTTNEVNCGAWATSQPK